MATLIRARDALGRNLRDCKSQCEDFSTATAATATAATAAATATAATAATAAAASMVSPSPSQPGYLDISILPADEILGQTQTVTILCDARGRSSDIIVATLLQVSDDYIWVLKLCLRKGRTFTECV